MRAWRERGTLDASERVGMGTTIATGEAKLTADIAPEAVVRSARETTGEEGAELMRAMRTWSVERHVPLVDVVHALDLRRDVLVSWVHLTPEGNEMIAEAFVPTILSLTCDAPRRAAALPVKPPRGG